MCDMLKVTLIKSLNGRLKKHIATAHSIGLRKIGDCTEQPDNEATKGKLTQIDYLVKAEKI
jgi:large subunit ribosomal protein L30